MRLAIAFHLALATLGKPPLASDDYVTAVTKQSPSGWMCWWNQQLGDCVPEDSGHDLMLRTANAGSILIPTAQDILGIYEAVGGYKPGDASTDQGCDETSMEQFMMSTGLCGHKSSATGPIDPTNLDHLRWAIQIFGGFRSGIWVNQEMESLFASKQPWETPADLNDPNAGGHDMRFVHYDGDYFYGVTWGGLQPVAVPLVQQSAFLQEAHLGVYPDFVRTGGTNPAGFNVQAMLDNAQAIEASS
jgi:hypothetical protein